MYLLHNILHNIMNIKNFYNVYISNSNLLLITKTNLSLKKNKKKKKNLFIIMLDFWGLG